MANESLAGRRIALTGASGFVGARIARALVDAGAQVHAYGRRTDGGVAGSDYRIWDLAQGPLMPAPQVDALVHCAGLTSEWGPRRDFVACHVDGTRHALASFPEPCPVVLISSASVYDPLAPKVMLREDAQFAPRYLNAYSETKMRAEVAVAERSKNIVLRPHAIYGPGDPTLLPRVLDAYRGKRLVAVGDGTNRVSLTHVDNLVDAALLALPAVISGDARGPFNICDEVPVIMGEVLQGLLRATGRQPSVVYLPRSLAWALASFAEFSWTVVAARRAPRLTRYRIVQIADEYTLDLARASRQLGYRPRRTVHDFLATLS